uniref:Uncharacterized protein n=1 Tax=Cannabis sativa TaxID=3483 RepID=A0A803NLW3_CANSA
MYDSREGAFANESHKSNSFIPTSLSKDKTPMDRAQEGSLSTGEIDRMVEELVELVTLEVQDSESTVSAQGNFAYPRIAPDVEVEEMGEDFELSDHEVEDDAEGRPTRSVLDESHVKIVVVLSSLPVQDRGWRLLCTSTKLGEHKLILDDAKL